MLLHHTSDNSKTVIIIELFSSPGIIPKDKPQEIKTVRIVKRESERRQRDRDRSGNIGIPITNGNGPLTNGGPMVNGAPMINGGLVMSNGSNATARRVTVIEESTEQTNEVN